MLKNIKFIFLLHFFIFAFAISSFASSVYNDESLALDWPDAEKWQIAHKQDSEEFEIIELVKSPEKISNWTELGTMQVFRNKAVDLDVFIEEIFKVTQENCKEATLKVLPDRLKGNYDSRMFVIKADTFKDNTSETQVQLVVQGNKALYNVQRTKRAADLEEKTINEWVEFLKTADIVVK